MILVLYIAAFLLFLGAAAWWWQPEPPRLRMVALGLALLTLTLFVGRL